MINFSFAIKHARIVIFAFFILIALEGFSSAAKAQTPPACAYPNLVEYPAKKPIWKLCWVQPTQSSGINASGLELRSVYYKDKLVLNRAHIPVLNVKYKNGGCGGQYYSYRDWLGHLQSFEADNIIQTGYAEPTRPPSTVCDHPGRDAGKFAGVAVEKLPDKLVLTSQFKSAWYRYIIKWTLYPDGTLEPRIGFSAIDYFCTGNPHTHHAFWRFDVDLYDPENDVIEEFNAGKWITLKEAQTFRDDPNKRIWRVRDLRGNSGILEILPGINDIKADKFAVADLWALQYKENEIDDGGAVRGPEGDQPHMDRFIDGDPISDGKSNVVVWYRSGTNHNGDANRCDIVGPTLKLLANSK